MNTRTPQPTIAALKDSAYDAELCGRYARAAELYTQAADAFTAQELTVSALSRDDKRLCIEAAARNRSMARHS